MIGGTHDSGRVHFCIFELESGCHQPVCIVHLGRYWQLKNIKYFPQDSFCTKTAKRHTKTEFTEEEKY